jgi:hypothetical protein
MTTRETEIETAVSSLIVEGRQRLGPPPSIDELMAYHRGELSEQEADRMQERLAHYPDSVRLLDALASYPYEGEPGDPDCLSDEELERAWLSVQDHLHHQAEVVRFPSKKGQPTEGGASRQLAAIAASVLLAVGAAGTWWVYSQRRVIEPSMDVSSQLAIPDGFRTARGGAPTIQLSGGADGYYLSLSVIDAPPYPDYRLEILDPASPNAVPLWSRAGIERRHDDTFELWLPRSFLTVRKIEIRLYGLDDEGTPNLLATYTVEV